MTSILKKKIKKKKKKRQDSSNNEIVPQKHEREGNLNFYSEEIAKSMVEKMISLSITENFVHNVNKKFSNFCLSNLISKTDQLVEILHINHENDDFDTDNPDAFRPIEYINTDSNEKRYKKQEHLKAVLKRNFLAEENLLNITNIDKEEQQKMYAHNKTIQDCLNKSVYVPEKTNIKRIENIQYDIKITKKNYWGSITEPKNINLDRTSSQSNPFIAKKDTNEASKKNKKNELTEDKKEKNKHFSRKNTFLSSMRQKKLTTKSIQEEEPIKKKKYVMIDFPSYDIPGIEFSKTKEPEEISAIRKETLELIRAKEEEIKRLEKLKKIKLKKMREEEQRKKKGKYTVGVDGQLLLMKEIRPDNFLKEFWPVNSKQKEVKPGKTLQYLKKEKIKMENTAKKNIEYNKEPQQYKLTMLKPRIEEIKDTNKEKQNDNNAFLYKKKSEDSSDNILQRFEPSGSNFQLIKPAVGVKIMERSRVKVGGTNFYERYHKYSIDEFNKTLKNNTEWSKNYLLKDRHGDNIFTNSLAKNLKKNYLDENNKTGNTYTAKSVKNKDAKLHKTYSTGFGTYGKNMQKSTSSELFTNNDKYPILKEILFGEDKYDKTTNYPFTENDGKKIKMENIFKNDNKNSSDGFSHKNIFAKNMKIKFSDMDKFNKNLIMGTFLPEKTYNQKLVLPRIKKNNFGREMGFDKTMSQFFRERTKKNIENELSFNKKKLDLLNSGRRMKKNYSAQNI